MRRLLVESSKKSASKDFGLRALGCLAAITAGTGLVGCGQGQSTNVGSMIDHVQVRSYTQDGNVWAEMIANLNTGSLILAGVDLPIIDPKHPEQQYGHIALRSSFCQPNSVCMGGGELAIAVNVTQVTQLKTLDNTLPNGTQIPVGGLANAAMITLPIGNTGARAYIALGQGIALLGAALPFKEFDNVGQYVPNVNIFQPFKIDPVQGVIGIFTSSKPGGNGIAVFADLSSVLDTGLAAQPQQIASAVSSLRSMAYLDNEAALGNSAAEKSVASGSVLKMQEVKPSAAKEKTLYERLYYLNQKRAKLNLK